MDYNIILSTGIIFVSLAVVFTTIAFQDYLKQRGVLTITRNVYLRIALIFSGIGAGLSFLNIFVH